MPHSPSPFTARLLAHASLLLLVGAAQAQEPCVPYQPTEAGEEIDATWAEQFEQDNYQFTVPSDPGGGYVIARVETSAPSRPQMRIIPPSGQGVVTQNVPTFPGPSPQVLEVGFEVAAGTTFTLEIFEDAVSSPPDFPVPYKWSWRFVSRVDCYEPNDGRPSSWPGPVATAKAIPLNQVLQAYSLAGFQTFGISGGDDANYDWYEFTLTEATEIWLSTLTVPTDQQIRVRLFDSAGNVIVDDEVPPVGETGAFGPRLLQPGSYYVDIHPEIRGDGEVTLSEGDSLPDHFDRPYHFIVSTSDPGFASLNGASFARDHGLASNSFVSGFGPSVVTPTLVDSALPETLGGFTIEITDSAGVVRNARMYVVASGQINFLMPPDAALGTATFRVLRDGEFVAAEVMDVSAVSPGIFSAASSGTGVAAAVFLLVEPGGERTEGVVFDSSLAAIPLDLGPAGSELYIFLFGTGLRNFTGEVMVTVDGVPVPFVGPVAQGQFDGLDQLNIGPLPLSLAGRGVVDIVVTIDGKQANVVTVAFL